MHTSGIGLNVIRSFEGRSLRAYKDEVGVWTIGYGLTNFDKNLPFKVQAGVTINEEEAERYFVEAIHNNYEPACVKALGGKLNQRSLDCASSFHYNTGGIGKATWVKEYAGVGDSSKIAASLLSWNKAGGRVLAGLTRRRKRELAILTSGDYGPEGRMGPMDMQTKKQLPPVFDQAGKRSDTPTQVDDTEQKNLPMMMRIGDDGEQVKYIQECLTALGYEVETDGKFLAKTDAAVRDFQSHHPQLTKDGVVGPATRSAIIRERALRDKVISTAKNTAIPTGAGVLSWKFLGLSVGKWLVVAGGVLAVALVAYLAWHYRDEIKRVFNKVLGREVA